LRRRESQNLTTEGGETAPEVEEPEFTCCLKEKRVTARAIKKGSCEEGPASKTLRGARQKKERRAT